MTDSEQLTSLLRERYRLLDDRNVVAILPVNLAAEAYSVIDPDGLAPLLVRWAAILELRQLARQVCRERCQEDATETEQSSLFDMHLQPRYPAARDDDIAYVLREKLTVDERRKNSSRLRREASAKNNHADALDAETDDLIRRGLLVAAVSEVA